MMNIVLICDFCMEVKTHGFFKASLRICYVSLSEFKGP